jgi:hypothetical protein
METTSNTNHNNNNQNSSGYIYLDNKNHKSNNHLKDFDHCDENNYTGIPKTIIYQTPPIERKYSNENLKNGLVLINKDKDTSNNNNKNHLNNYNNKRSIDSSHYLYVKDYELRQLMKRILEWHTNQNNNINNYDYEYDLIMNDPPKLQTANFTYGQYTINLIKTSSSSLSTYDNMNIHNHYNNNNTSPNSSIYIDSLSYPYHKSSQSQFKQQYSTNTTANNNNYYNKILPNITNYSKDSTRIISTNRGPGVGKIVRNLYYFDQVGGKYSIVDIKSNEPNGSRKMVDLIEIPYEVDKILQQDILKNPFKSGGERTYRIAINKNIVNPSEQPQVVRVVVKKIT